MQGHKNEKEKKKKKKRLFTQDCHVPQCGGKKASVSITCVLCGQDTERAPRPKAVGWRGGEDKFKSNTESASETR